jgi:hypothetical protein
VTIRSRYHDASLNRTFYDLETAYGAECMTIDGPELPVVVAREVLRQVAELRAERDGLNDWRVAA